MNTLKRRLKKMETNEENSDEEVIEQQESFLPKMDIEVPNISAICTI